MSLEIGRVYVVHTTLTKPAPKDKIVVCVKSDPPPLFLWFNSKAQLHGSGQMACDPVDHDALSQACFLDLSRVTTFSEAELASAKERDFLSVEMRERICAAVHEGVAPLPPRYAKQIIENLRLAE